MVSKLKNTHSLIRIILKPLVRYSLRGSVLISEFIEITKQVFVEVASEEIARSSKQVNVSRLSVSTGLYRRDVKRIYVDQDEVNTRSKSILWRVIGQWELDREFTNSRGQPKILSYTGNLNEFERLVGKVTTAIGAAAVLFELERIGAAERTPRGLKLKRQGEVIQEDALRAFQILGDDLEALIRCVEINSSQDPRKQLHIRTEFDNVSNAQLEEIRLWIKEEGKAFHRRVREYVSKFDADITPEKVAGESKNEPGKVIVTAFGLAE